MRSKMRCRKLSQFAGATWNFRSDSMFDEASTSQCNDGFRAWFKRVQIATPPYEAASRRVLMNFLCFNLFAGSTDEDELFQTRSEFWDRPEVLHGVAARGAY